MSLPNSDFFPPFRVANTVENIFKAHQKYIVKQTYNIFKFLKTWLFKFKDSSALLNFIPFPKVPLNNNNNKKPKPLIKQMRDLYFSNTYSKQEICIIQYELQGNKIINLIIIIFKARKKITFVDKFIF